jgi:Na+/H+-dicarboxylate symporter
MTQPIRARTTLLRALYSQVLIAIVLGVVFGVLWPKTGAALKPLADGFVSLIKMMVAPVVFCTIVLGISGMPDAKEIGKTLLKAMLLFYLLTALSLVFGLGAVFAFHPGSGMNINPASLDASVAAKLTKGPPRSLTEFLLHIIPQSFVGAFADGEVLPILLLAIIVGLAMIRLGKTGQPVRLVLDSFLQILFIAFGMIVKLSPIAAFAAMAYTVGAFGLKALNSLALLVGTYYLASIAFVVIVIGLFAYLHKVNLWKLVRYFREELLIIFGTSTSEPVFPRLIQKLESLGCQKGIVGMVLPLSYSFNLDGIAIFLAVGAVFIAQACNIHLSMERVLAMLLLMLLTSKGAAGVAGSGFVALIATLTVMPDIPVAGVALLVGVDRFMSGMRAVTSTISNATATIAIAQWENSCDLETLRQELDSGYRSTEQALEENQLAEPHQA